jgi:AAA domain-containing protein
MPRDLASFYSIYGPKTVFVPLAHKSKRPTIDDYPNLTLEQTLECDYQKLLREAPGMSVLLGPPSNDLSLIDFDQGDLYPSWKTLNLWEETRHTRGSQKGRHVWFRMQGEYPKKVHHLAKTGEPSIGEWRGAQLAKIDGLHDNGVDHYGPIFDRPIQEIAWERIAWQTRFNPPELEKTEAEIPPPEKYSQFVARDIFRPITLVKDLLDIESRLIIGGASKTFKSWAMIDMALSLASDTDWWGFPCYSASAIYINFELKDYYAKNRFEKVRLAKGIKNPPENLFVWNLRGYDVSGQSFKDMVASFVSDNAVSAIFIDPFYRLLGEADERVSSELMPVLLLFEQISRQCGASVICAAHFSKGNQAAKDPFDRISGGAALSRHPDSLITLTAHENPDSFTVDTITRDFKTIDPFVVNWAFPIFVRANDLNPKDIKKLTKNTNDEYNKDDILNALREHDNEFNTTQLQEYLTEEIGMSRAHFFRLFKQIQNDVFKSIDTKKWNLNPI